MECEDELGAGFSPLPSHLLSWNLKLLAPDAPKTSVSTKQVLLHQRLCLRPGSSSMPRAVIWDLSSFMCLRCWGAICLGDLWVSTTVLLPVGTIVGSSIVWSDIVYCKNTQFPVKNFFNPVPACSEAGICYHFCLWKIEHPLWSFILLLLIPVYDGVIKTFWLASQVTFQTYTSFRFGDRQRALHGNFLCKSI